MRRVVTTIFVLAVAVAVTMTLGACAKKPKPTVEVPETPETRPPEGEPAEPIRAETPVTPEATARVQLEDVFFDFDRYNLRPDALRSMEKNARILKESPGVRVTLEGHCDERGTNEYNLALGEKRARAAHDYLTRYGIDGSRLTVISYGEERPFDPGHDEAAWAKNRRVHFIVHETG